MSIRRHFGFAALTAMLSIAAMLRAGTPANTSITYQGQLKQAGSAINATADFKFRFYDALMPPGNLVGSEIPQTAITLTNGLFTVQLPITPGMFNGSPRWLEIDVRSPAGSGTYTTLSPRQPINPAPYAAFAYGVDLLGDSALAGTYSNPINLTNAQNSFAGQALDINGNIKVSGWIGTDDNAPVSFFLNNAAALRLEPARDDRGSAINIIGGNSSTIGNVIGVTIAGGSDCTAAADYATISGGWGHNVNAHYATIGGGLANFISTSAEYATIGGGYGHVAMGHSATIGGGHQNSATSIAATVSGGYDNVATAHAATVCGGGENSANGFHSAVVGGVSNTADAWRSAICGGSFNFIYSPAMNATIAGGTYNSASGTASMIAGGESNATTGSWTFAAGRGAFADHDGSFVWSDSSRSSAHSTGNDQFVIDAAGGVRLVPQSGTPNIQAVAPSSDNPENLILNPLGGNVGIGTMGSPPAEKLHVNGSIQASCGIVSCSDIRFKQHIEPLHGALDLVNSLRAVTFDWKRSEFPDRNFTPGRQIGFIAQEVEQVLPQVVSTGSDGYKSVDYSRLTPVLMEAVQELRAEKDAEIQSLRDENADLRARIESLERITRQLAAAQNGGTE